MKTKLLFMLFVGMLSVNAQTTHNLDWFTGIGSTVDLTIDAGDTVIWTWTDSPPHTVQNVNGSSVETFNSGTLTGNGQTFSYMFNVVGDNDYFCGIHGAASMSGTITVEATSGTTHNLDWFTNIGSNVDLTIETGDTVIWTWTNPNHTVENVPFSSAEMFNSGFLGPIGSTFEYTFTDVGDNDYFCGVHGAVSMSGTITVEDNLGIDDELFKSFKILQNPVTNILELEFPQNINEGQIIIYDMLGKQVITTELSNSNNKLIDVSPLKSGLYIITIKSEGVSQTKRFIKI